MPKPEIKGRSTQRPHRSVADPDIVLGREFADPALTIDPDHPLYPVRDLAKEGTGNYPSCVTMWRWCAGKGASGGLRLPAVKLAGKWMTTRAVWLAWLQARTARMEARRRKDTDSDDDLDALL